ncbi:MAG: DUF1015 domain-containing protein, partial [Eubacteriales bacterium]|nr:DUF1015 domain-containing protein [Eubacteriales bacterium]
MMIDHSASRLAATLQKAKQIGVSIPTLYLPQTGTDLARWAIVACDQFTSQPAYWQKTEALVGQAPSTLRLVLPEIYLEYPGDTPLSERIAQINQTMAAYIDHGVIMPLAPGAMLIDRKTNLHASRKGLLLAIDLETYDFKPGNRELTRATEGTVLDRIPPRQAIRKDALLELPHVQLLIDDPDRTVIEPLYAYSSQQQPLYSTDLMQDGGAVRGWAIPADSDALSQAIEALAALESVKAYGLLFAVGDGNHSLATAKAHWDSIKATVSADHPARFALTEIINIHDHGLEFEPIHRAVFNIDLALFQHHAERYFAKLETQRAFDIQTDSYHVPVYGPDRSFFLHVTLSAGELLVGAIQAMLDDLLTRHPEARLDYIHGEDVIHELAAAGAIGLTLPALDKAEFFGIIARDGILPRKTFSMGEAFEKRY